VEERLLVGRIKAAVERRHGWAREAIDRREVDMVEVEVNHVEPIRLTGDELDQPDVMRQGVPARRLLESVRWSASGRRRENRRSFP
jgi:hypothetical protein